jgi:hypothetical protein
LSPDLATALRTETPTAPERLRDRVAQIATVPPPARRAFPVRRVLALGVPAALAASVVGAAVIGLATSSGTPAEFAEAEKTLSPVTSSEGGTVLDRTPPARLRAAGPAATPTPTRGRAQHYSATLTVLVDNTDDLSSKTQRALRATRRLGGYVVTVRYGTPEATEGTATLRLRIPVSRVQAAIVQFSELGRILAQQVQISDLQQPLDTLTRRIRRLERRAAGLKGAELARVKAQIAALRRQRAEINRRAAFAAVSLDLTTHEPEKKEAPPGRLDRAIDDATGVLAAEVAIVAYGLIVASPILLLLVAGLVGSRAYRRYADQRLLERA